jgi:flavin reductase (DIM6/NTAB) family NADH-FMN oxidoreductase RutF
MAEPNEMPTYRQFSPQSEEWTSLPERWRATLVNSASGFKPLVVIGTFNANGINNLAVFSQLIHVGANPPLLGVLFRPDSAERHTLTNLRANGRCTVNAVADGWHRKAHQTSARYPEETSEFDAVGWPVQLRPEWPAPFAAGSPVQWAARLHSEVPLANGTHLVVLEVVEFFVDAAGIGTDGYVDLAALHVLTVNGLDAYYRTESVERLAYAKPGTEPTSLTPQPDRP